jgi:hypothetical protein
MQERTLAGDAKTVEPELVQQMTFKSSASATSRVAGDRVGACRSWAPRL